MKATKTSGAPGGPSSAGWKASATARPAGPAAGAGSTAKRFFHTWTRTARPSGSTKASAEASGANASACAAESPPPGGPPAPTAPRQGAPAAAVG